MAAEMLKTGDPGIELEVKRLRALLETARHADALAAANALLERVPENRDVLYIAAVALRYLKRVPEALSVLERFERLHPDYARLHQERGHCLRDTGRRDEAIAAYRRAVALNAALPASWRALELLYRATGQGAEAEASARYRAELDALPPPIVAASSLFNEGETLAAERVVRHFLQTHGNHIEGMRLLAQIGVKLDVLDDAEFLLESVVEFAPEHGRARYEYGVVLSKRHRYAAALEQADRLLAAEPGNRDFHILRAGALVGVGDHETALAVYRRLLEETPRDPELHLSVAHALKTLGRQADAIEVYRQAAAVAPSFGDAYWSLANLKTYRFSDDEIAHMRAQECRSDIRDVDRYHLCFALGKALEDRGEYAESFRCYERGNAEKKRELRYRPELIERGTELKKQVCTGAMFEARRGWGSPRPDPIFIVGLTRAGSTLIEQILASHPAVEGTMELADIPRLVQRLQGRGGADLDPRYPGILAELTREQLEQFGERYLEDTAAYRSGRPRFVDKMPNNFRHVGLIHLILPNAKVIDARRDAMACCFSNYKQLFASGQEFTYGLEDIGRYFKGYVELMEHWDRVLPGKVLRVQHESLVEDLEGNVRRILDFCGLEFEPRCLEFHKTERSVRTASSEQVRRPIFREGLDQWRRYEPWLGPLKQALGIEHSQPQKPKVQ